MPIDQQREFKLGEWLVTPLRGVLHGPAGSRRVTPKAMDVLLCLAQRPGEVVNRDTFLKEVWDGHAYSDEPLNKCIAELRRQLGDSGGTRDYIETIPKRGYRLVASVSAVSDSAPENFQSGMRSGTRVITAGLTLALVAGSAWFLTANNTEVDSISLAVLPFDSLSQEEKTYFADGVHEELIGELSQNKSLAVRSRTSTLQYRNTTLTLPQIANELDVDIIVEGSVRQDRDTVRVTAQLIQANTDEHLWSGNIDRSLSVAGLFDIQIEIAKEIANALRVTLKEDSQAERMALPTDNIRAYDNFMLGKYHYRRKLPGDIRVAVASFEESARLDPLFADAWDWLAYAYNHAATGVGHLEPSDAYPKARAAALRALDINPDLATAISILGYIRAIYDRDWVGAESDLLFALRLNPDDSGTVWSLAHIYSLLGRHDEAVDLARSFAARFPSAGRHHREVANRLIDANRFTEALAFLDAALEHDDEPAQVADTRGVALYGLQRFQDALLQFEYSVTAKQRDAGAVARLAHLYGVLGRREEALDLLAELESRSASERISALSLATAHAGLGDNRAALDYLQKAATQGSRGVLSVHFDPFFAGVRNEAEYQRIVASLEIPRP